MSRKNRRVSEKNREINEAVIFGGARTEVKRNVQYQVRRTLSGRSVYKCPGCNNSIPAGATSVTVIELNHFLGQNVALDDRRHWHNACWKRFR